MRSQDSDRIDIRTDQYDASIQESTSMVEEADASQIAHISVKLKQGNPKRNGISDRKRQFIAIVCIFVMLILSFGYLLSKKDGKAAIKESKGEKIEGKDKKIVDQKQKSENKNDSHLVIKENSESKRQDFQAIDNLKNILDIPNLLQIEKYLWLFETEQHSNTLRRLYYQNNKHFAKVGGYKTVIISKTNARQYMTQQTKQKYDKVVKIVGKENNVANNFALVCILADNGGIMITDYLAITEPMQWVNRLNNDINIRRGKNIPKIQVFGYYDPQASSPNVKQNIEVEYEVQKYVRIFPGLLPYFLLAKKNAAFMRDLVDEVVLMITDPVEAENRAGINFYGVQQSIQHHYFTMAVHRLLQKTQKTLNSQLKPGQKTHLAVDLYGLYYINQLAGVRKIWALFGDGQTHVQYQSLSRMSKEELYSYIGHFKYIGRISPQPVMNQYLQEAINKKRYPIVKGSFVQQVLFPNTEGLDYIIDNPQKFITDQNGKIWDALPKIIWLYWHSGHQNAAVSIQLAVQSMKRRAKQSNFEVRLVNDYNLKDYLDAKTIQRIQYSLKNAKVTIFPPSKSDFIRLALISTHGGVYFDSSYMALTNFDWLVNISRYRSQYIHNRFGELPKVLVHFHPQWGGVFQWQFNTTVNTKVQWQLPYESNFIAAEKGSQFVKEWFQLHLELYLKPYHQIAGILDSCGLAPGFSRWGSQYLIVMDGAKCVVGRKQKQLKQNKLLGYSSAVEYYGLWAISGYMGIQKYRDRTGFETHTNVDNNFAYRYSQEYVQSLIGSNFNLVKFYGAQHNNAVSNFIISNVNNLQQQAHPQSLFMKYLIPKNLKLENVAGKWVIKY